MADRKIIAIVGATGAQGGALAQAILNDTESGFAVRALTRDVNSEKAKKLAAMGAEVVEADVEDTESLRRAFEGAHGAFCITFFWEHFSPEKEQRHAANLAEAARQAGVNHVIWSTLEDTRNWIPLDDDRMPTLQEKYKVPHFDAKGAANRFFTEKGVPTTFLQTSFYWENFIHFGAGPQKGPDGRLALTMPMGDSRLPGIAVEDIGKCAYTIFKQGDEMIGQTVSIAGEHLTGTELAAAMSRAVGQEIVYNDVPAEVYRSFEFAGADDMGNMFQFKRDFEEYFVGARDLDKVRELNPSLQSFEQWLAENGSRIPLS